MTIRLVQQRVMMPHHFYVTFDHTEQNEYSRTICEVSQNLFDRTINYEKKVYVASSSGKSYQKSGNFSLF